MADRDRTSLTVTVHLDSAEVLRLDGSEARMERLLFADQARVVAALAKALQVVVEHQPGPSELVQALNRVEVLAAAGDPPEAPVALGFIRAAIEDAGEAFTAALAEEPPDTFVN